MAALDETVELTLKLPSAVADRLKDIAKITDRAESDVVADALDSYLSLTPDQIRIINDRVKQADAGDFASDDEVAQFFAKYGT